MYVFVVELFMDYEGGSDISVFATEMLARKAAGEMMKIKSVLWRIRKTEPGLSFLPGLPEPPLIAEWHSPVLQETIKLWRLVLNDSEVMYTKKEG